MNFVKLFVLTVTPVGVLVGGGYVINEEATLFGSLISLVIVFGTYWLSDKVVLKMCSGELLTPYHSPTIFRLVKEMSHKAGVQMPKIYAIPGETPNALSTGRSVRKAAIAFTEGTLHALSEDELRSVISHEIIHIKNGDTLVASITALIAGVLGVGITTKSAEISVSESALVKSQRLVWKGYRYLLAPLPAFFVQSFTNIKREFVTDDRGARLTGDPLSLANAIRTMEKRKHQSPLHLNPAVAHLFTVSPLTVGRTARLFNTHPPMEERIARLEALARRGVGRQRTKMLKKGK